MTWEWTDTDAAGSGTDAPVRIWGAHGGIIRNSVIIGLYLLMGIGLVLAGALEEHGTAPLVTGIIVCAIAVPRAASYVGSFGRPVTIHHGMLRIPRSFTTTTIPLSQVSGIGLIYRPVPQFAGWALAVWGSDEKPVPIRRFILRTTQRSLPKLAPGVRRRYGGQADWTIPFANENIDVLTESKPGQAAIKLYQSTLLWQVPTGPLRSRALQKAIEYERGSRVRTVAWWAPDGTMGRASGIPPADPNKLADPSLYKGSHLSV